jgi:hypothetical protein
MPFPEVAQPAVDSLPARLRAVSEGNYDHTRAHSPSATTLPSHLSHRRRLRHSAFDLSVMPSRFRHAQLETASPEVAPVPAQLSVDVVESLEEPVASSCAACGSDLRLIRDHSGGGRHERHVRAVSEGSLLTPLLVLCTLRAGGERRKHADSARLAIGGEMDAMACCRGGEANDNGREI